MGMSGSSTHYNREDERDREEGTKLLRCGEWFFETVFHRPKVVIYPGFGTSSWLCGIRYYGRGVSWTLDAGQDRMENVFALLSDWTPLWQVATSSVELWLGNNLVNCCLSGSNNDTAKADDPAPSSSSLPPVTTFGERSERLIECSRRLHSCMKPYVKHLPK